QLTPPQRDYQKKIGRFALGRLAPAAASIDESGDFPRELVKEAAELGLLGVTTPGAWGGGGLECVTYAFAMGALGGASSVVAVIAGVNTSLVAEPIAQFGTDA